MQTEKDGNSSGILLSKDIADINFCGFEKAVSSLEFDKIIQQLIECTTVEGSREMLSGIRPSVSVENVRYMLRQTTEAKQMMSVKGMPSFGGVKDIKLSLERCDKGAPLNMAELLQIAGVLQSARSVSEYFSGYKGSEEF